MKLFFGSTLDFDIGIIQISLKCNKMCLFQRNIEVDNGENPHYRCLPCRGSGAYTRSNIDLVN